MYGERKIVNNNCSLLQCLLVSIAQPLSELFAVCACLRQHIQQYHTLLSLNGIAFWWQRPTAACWSGLSEAQIKTEMSEEDARACKSLKKKKKQCQLYHVVLYRTYSPKTFCSYEPVAFFFSPPPLHQSALLQNLAVFLKLLTDTVTVLKKVEYSPF